MLERLLFRAARGGKRVGEKAEATVHNKNTGLEAEKAIVYSEQAASDDCFLFLTAVWRKLKKRWK